MLQILLKQHPAVLGCCPAGVAGIAQQLTCLSITRALAVTASGAAAWHKYSKRWSAASKSGCWGSAAAGRDSSCVRFFSSCSHSAK